MRLDQRSVEIDGIIFSLQKHGGISVYFRELLNYLVKVGFDTLLTVDQPLVQSLSDLPKELMLASRVSRRLERFRSSRLNSLPSVFHSSYYRRPSRPDTPTVVTVHDFTYERFRQGPARWAHVWQKHAAIRQAQAIICISESTRDDLLQFVGVRTDQSLHVIHNGVGKIFEPLSIEPSSRPFILFVGDRRGYKNFSLVLRALDLLTDIELHCVGGGQFRDEEFIGFNPILRERVRHLGFLTDEELNVAYNQAMCLVYPSRYEGFGIPVIEAMKAGCPVICVNCKAVIEVGGEALEKLDEEDPQALANAVLRLCEPLYRENRISAGLQRARLYDWELCHSQTLNVYRKLANTE